MESVWLNWALILTVLVSSITPTPAQGGSAASTGESSATGSSLPNIVLILADDLGFGDLSCYGGKTQTPHIDRMAKEGVRFTRYYAAAPICSPSRSAIITGQFPGRWRITNCLHQTRAGNRACGQADFLDPDAPSLPRAMKAAGYKTAHVGKWHLSGGGDVAGPPFAAYGYDHGIGTWESSEPHPDLTAQNWIWSIDDKVKRWDRTGWMVDRVIEFLKNDSEAPRFINLWLDDPHTPWIPSADYLHVREGDNPERLMKVLTVMDRQVGRLLDAVRNQNKNRPTLVLLLSDNGPLPTFDRQRTTGLRGSKLSLYEGGIRVPFIVWSPRLVDPAGVMNDSTVLAAVDLFPTLFGLCGLRLPEDYSADGENLSSAFLGKTPYRSKPLFWEYGRNATAFTYPTGGDRSPALATLDGDWKLLVNPDGSGAELYNLLVDPKEERNILADKPDIARRLVSTTIDWRKSLP